MAVALAGAAEQAWRRGAPDTAANLLRLACRLTPPTDAEALTLRRVAFGRLLHSAGGAAGAAAGSGLALGGALLLARLRRRKAQG